MTTIRVIGIDLGKNTFHLIGHDYSGREVFRKKLNRQKLLQLLSVHEPVIVAMEACGGAHWLALYFDFKTQPCVLKRWIFD